MKPLTEISLHDKVQRNPNMVTSKIDNEVVMMSVDQGEYYGLDETGSRIWEMIEEPVSVNDLVRMLIDEFDVSFEECQKDTLDFLNDLNAKGLLFVTH